MAYKLLQIKRFVENNLLQLIILFAVVIGVLMIFTFSGESEPGLGLKEQTDVDEPVIYKNYSKQQDSGSDADSDNKNKTIAKASKIDAATIAALVKRVKSADTGKVDVESTALQLIQNSEWDNENIISLTHGWITLSKSQQFIYKQSVWFQLLENTLIHKLQQVESSSPSPNDDADEHRELLSSLAQQLAIEVPAKREQIKAKPTLVATVETNSENGFVDLDAFADAPENTDKIPLNKIVRADVDIQPTEVENVIDTEAIKRKRLKAQNISSKEVRAITNKFVNYYQSGDIDQFVSLFSTDVLSNDVNDLSGLKKEYEQLFETTASRKMIVHNVKWSYDGNQAEGKGSMVVNIKVGENDKPSIFQGKIQFVLEKNNEDIHITRFFHDVK